MKFRLSLVLPLLVAATACDTDDSNFRRSDEPCKIERIKDARACMANLGIPEFEGPNSIQVVVADKNTRLIFERVLNGLVTANFLDKDDQFFAILETVHASKYLAVVNQHQDEDMYFYFALTRGEKVVPFELIDFNVVDLDPYPVEVQPLDWALGRKNIPGWHYEDFEELFQDALEAAEE